MYIAGKGCSGNSGEYTESRVLLQKILLLIIIIIYHEEKLNDGVRYFFDEIVFS